MPIWTFVVIFVLQAINLVLGGFILRRNPKSRLNQSLAFFIFVAVMWGLTMAIAVLKGTTFWGATPFVFGVLAVFGLYWVSVAFPVKVKYQIPVKILFPIAMIVGFLGYVPGAYFNGVQVVNGSLQTELGPAYPILLIFVSFCFIIAAVNFIRKYRKSSGILKLQFKYLILGISIFVGAAVLTNVILPAIGITTFNAFAPSLAIFFIGFATYAMLRYRLMDVSSLVSRSLVYVVLVAVLTGLFASNSFVISALFEDRYSIPSVLVYAAMSVAIVLLYDPLKKLLSRGSAAVFGSKNYEAMMSELGRVAQQELDMEKLISQVNNTLQSQLHIEKSCVLLPGKRGLYDGHYHTEGGEHDSPKQINIKLIARALKTDGQTIVRAELQRMLSDESVPGERRRLEKLLAEFDTADVAVLSPVFEKGKLKMLIGLKDKVGGGLFTPQEISVLEVVGPQVAAALEKANLYQETLGFAEELKAKVASATKRLQENNLYLKELDKTRAEFISITSHQLRTPLSGITGYLSMLSEGDYGRLQVEQRRVINDVLSASHRLTRMVDVFLNVSRIEAGRFIMNFSEQDFSQMVSEVFQTLRLNAEKKSLDISLQLPKKAGAPILLDADKAKDVIGNLIDNAIKYTDSGSIRVAVKDESEDFLFSVADTGMGIRSSDAGRLFDKFSRGTGMAKIGKDGSGLGLFVAKKIVDAHGGKIWVESEGLGKGSTFFVKWPKKPKQHYKQTKERVTVA